MNMHVTYAREIPPSFLNPRSQVNVIHVARQIKGAFPHIIPPRNSTPASHIGPGHHRLHRELIVPSAKVTNRVPQKTFRSKSHATLAKVNTSQSLRSPLDWHIGRKTEMTSIERTPNKWTLTKSRTKYAVPLSHREPAKIVMQL